jgi:C-terminal processing protease CtpA/Prc
MQHCKNETSDSCRDLPDLQIADNGSAEMGGIGMCMRRDEMGEFTIKSFAPNSPSLLCGQMKVFS